MKLRNNIFFYFLISSIALISCKGNFFYKNIITQPTDKYLDTDGNTVLTRIECPDDFERVITNNSSFNYYLRNLPLKNYGTDVKYFDGTDKNRLCHVGVVDMDVGDKDLQQCADSGIRLYAEYLYQSRQFDKISFNFTNGFECAYRRYAMGWRVEVEGNTTTWYKAKEEDYSYKNFRRYLDLVFMYAGSYSLSQELKKVEDIADIKPGDLFIHPGFPGHVEIVMDVCNNKKTGEKLFLLAQGFTPAQEIEILENEEDGKLSPWFSTDVEKIETPQMVFEKNEIYRFNL